MKENEIEEGKKKIKELNDLVIVNRKRSHQRGVNMIDKELWVRLHDFELEIRGVMRSSGLQQKIRDKIDMAGL